MSEPISTWNMIDQLKDRLGVLEMDRRVHRVCRYLRQDRECKRCPMWQMDDVEGVEKPCQNMCYGMASEVIAYANGAVHPREAKP